MTELSAELKETIQTGYRRFLASRDLKPRVGQRQMIGAIARTLGQVETDAEGDRTGDAPICVVEAGTGTGKTLAYLLPVLPIAKAEGKTVVVATGTVSLQSQLLEKDIPQLLEATGWHYNIALAKGRGRYLCNIRLEQCLDATGAREAGLFLFEDELAFTPDRASDHTLKAMSEAIAEGSWDGDRDRWPAAVDDRLWRALTVDRRQCSGNRCRKIHECSFFQARSTLDDADCIIANHDLVLADLALGGGVILPAPEETIYVFDEAHRLADTTLRHFGNALPLQGSIQWLEQMVKGVAMALKTCQEALFLRQLLERVSGTLEATLQQLRLAAPALRSQLDQLLPPGADHYRFPNGDIGEENRNLAEQIARQGVALNTRLEELTAELEKALEDQHCPVPKVDIESLFQAVGTWHGRAEVIADLWLQMAEPDPPDSPPRARWLAVDSDGQDILVAVSPISAAELLRSRLWSRCFGAVATSATLRALGKFDRFAATVGLPRHARTLAVPGAFDYARCGVLAIPDIDADGSDAAAHTEALIRHLPGLFDGNEGTLVLFASRRQMETVFDALDRTLADRVLMQGQYSHSELLRRHREAVDGGDGSVVFGLASFAEGLDLPGDYCRHVIIAKLPFAVPDNPLQSAQAEWLETRGLNPFQAMTLPDASLRLIQACGRLLRTEQDRGRVTILDRRLVTRFYGRQLVDALPPFRREGF
ncbi:MAG: ATP-dependent DNA helicase DinG [Porticoccaceae bacterium]|nr:ATP-dependent DNA helicase DinG [Porticoccaceae bacterium]